MYVQADFNVPQGCLFHQETKWTTGQFVSWTSFILCCSRRVLYSMGKSVSLPSNNYALEQRMSCSSRAIILPYLADQCNTFCCIPSYWIPSNWPTGVSLGVSKLDSTLNLAKQQNHFKKLEIPLLGQTLQRKLHVWLSSSHSLKCIIQATRIFLA